MRLIDADVLKDWLTSHNDLEFDPISEKELLRLIDDQPTAFDLCEDSVFWVTCTQCRLDAAPSRNRTEAIRRWNDRVQKWLYEEENNKNVK